jgi:hypothetical protein
MERADLDRSMTRARHPSGRLDRIVERVALDRVEPSRTRTVVASVVGWSGSPPRISPWSASHFE